METNGRKRVLQFVAAIVGTVIISIVGAFIAFGSTQAEQLVRLEASENEDLRQREIDRLTVQALNEALRVVQARLSELETRIAVLEAQIAASSE